MIRKLLELTFGLMWLAVLFAVVAVLACAACAAAILAVSTVEMEGSDAIMRDGLRPGSLAPAWALTDTAGAARSSPPAGPLQLVVFGGHSLKSFPAVVAGLRALAAEAPDVEIVVLLRRRNDIARPLLAAMGLDAVPVVTGSPSLYGRYNVRVTPWLIFVDDRRRVRASSLVNEDWQVTRLYHLARLPLDSPGPAVAGRRQGAGAGR